MRHFTDSIETMRTGWKRSWFRFILDRTIIGKALQAYDAKPSEEGRFEIMRAYLSSSWFFGLWFSSYLDYEQTHNFRIITLGVSWLEATGLFNSDSFNAVSTAKAYPGSVAEAIIELERAGLRTRVNLDALKNHKKSLEIGITLEKLNYLGILTQENFNALVNLECLDLVPDVFSVLCIAKMHFKYLPQISNLTKESLNLLFTPEYKALLTKEAFYNFWHQIHKDVLITYWPQILEQARGGQKNPSQLKSFVDQLDSDELTGSSSTGAADQSTTLISEPQSSSTSPSFSFQNNDQSTFFAIDNLDADSSSTQDHTHSPS